MPHPRRRHDEPFRLSMLPRRFIIAFCLGVSLTIYLIVSSASPRVDVPAVQRPIAKLSESAQRAAELFPSPKLPKLYNLFVSDAHEPAEQDNSTHGDTKWYSDLKWLNPFSSTITLDEDRAVLPPLPERPPIYTYYEKTDEDPNVVEAENAILLAWRRAWWAQGFRPIVLGKPDAMKNPLHEQLSGLNLEPNLELEFKRWLAWEYMGGGILANWLAFSMGRFEDSLLSSLRSSAFEELKRFKGLETGLFAGRKKAIGPVIKQALESDNIKKTSAFLDIISRDAFEVDSPSDSIAYYSMPTLKSQYDSVAERIKDDEAAGLLWLKGLINSHLQLTWQNDFPAGISLIKPHGMHMTTLTTPAHKIAQTLASCPESPLPHSCPPNRPRCTPCDPTNTMKISTSDSFINRTALFTVGTVAHPLTFNSLYHFKEAINANFVRRKTLRDQWLEGITRKLLGPGLGGPQRLIKFKEAVAGEVNAAHSLWITAEREEHLELEWIFGFEMPHIDEEAAEDPTRLPQLQQDGKPPPPMEFMKEKAKLDLAREVLASSSVKDRKFRDMVEGWNLADAEAWRFVRAYRKRKQVERGSWANEESRFAGAAN